MNILDKTDRSIALKNSKQGSDGMEKKDRYGWSDVEQGEHKEISKYDLNIDGTYQRDQVSEKKVLDIARDFSFALFGSLSVAQRADGTYWVYDGGHRLRACFRRKEIDKVPCRVIQISDLQQEADLFLKANSLKSAVSALSKYRAELVSKTVPESLAAERILRKFGYAASNSEGPRKIEAIAALKNAIKNIGEETMEVVFDILADVYEYRTIPRSTLNGLAHLFKMIPGLSSDESVKTKLVEAGSILIKREINNKATILGLGINNRVAALALLDIINKNRRRRYSLDLGV